MKTETVINNNCLSVHHFSIGDYHRLEEAGILTEDDNVELIEGRVVDMAPIGSKHMACVDYVSNLLVGRLRGDAIVRVQGPIDLTVVQSEPEPDIAILIKRADFYKDAHPQSKDILLIIEVADSSLEYDRNIKIPLYARALIREAWLINLVDNVIEIYQSPSLEGYRTMTRLDHTLAVSPQSFPEISITLAEILNV